jgi:hypothetical protein
MVGRFGRRASPVPLHYQTLWGSGGQAEHSPASGGHAHGEMRNPGSGLQRVAVRCTEQVRDGTSQLTSQSMPSYHWQD